VLGMDFGREARRCFAGTLLSTLGHGRLGTYGQVPGPFIVVEGNFVLYGHGKGVAQVAVQNCPDWGKPV
jgi:hypothetical protein